MDRKLLQSTHVFIKLGCGCVCWGILTHPCRSMLLLYVWYHSTGEGERSDLLGILCVFVCARVKRKHPVRMCVCIWGVLHSWVHAFVCVCVLCYGTLRSYATAVQWRSKGSSEVIAHTLAVTVNNRDVCLLSSAYLLKWIWHKRSFYSTSGNGWLTDSWANVTS